MKFYTILILLSLISFSHATVYENAEDKLSSRWHIYDNTPEGATVINILDEQQGRIIEIKGETDENGFALGGIHGQATAWNNSNEQLLTWDMKFDDDFTIFISLNTTKGHRYLLYSPQSISYEYSHGLGTSAKDGTWRSYSRNLSDDLHDIDNSNNIITVDGFFIRGSGRLDNIELKDNNDTSPLTKIVEEWRIYDNTPNEASITYIEDEEKGDVIKLTGNNTENGYAIGGITGTSFAWNDTDNRKITWSMNFDEFFIIFISLNTTKGHHYLMYAPISYNTDYLYGLGTDAQKGTWKTFSRDLEADLKNIDPSNTIISVDGFLIRGSGLIGDISIEKNTSSLQECNTEIDNTLLLSVDELLKEANGGQNSFEIDMDNRFPKYGGIQESGNYLYMRTISDGLFFQDWKNIVRVDCRTHKDAEIVYEEEQNDFLSSYVGTINSIAYYTNYYDSGYNHGIIGLTDTLPLKKLYIATAQGEDAMVIGENFVTYDYGTHELKTYNENGELLSTEIKEDGYLLPHY